MGRWRRGGVMVGTTASASLGLLLWSSPGPASVAVPVAPHGEVGAPAEGSLRVMSLNVAHGRGERFSQYLVRRAEHEAYLDGAGDLVRSHAPHVVALQEVDGPSWPTGRFDHLARLAAASRKARSVRGTHVDLPGLRYGASLLGDVELTEASSHTFGRTLPSPPKGFVVARTTLDGRPVDVVSVHLDFASRWARGRQVRQLAQVVRDRGHPVVLLGDFNMGWDAHAMQWLVDELQLHTVDPEVPLVTFPSTGDRLDWVLASPELTFVSHDVVDTPVSDHRAVVGALAWGR